MTIDERLAHIDVKIGSNQAEFRRFWSESKRSADDLHAFSQQMTLRSEYINQQQVAILKELQAGQRKHRGEWRDSHSEWRESQAEWNKRFEDQRDEDRAQREALFRILDRLDGKDPPTEE